METKFEQKLNTVLLTLMALCLLLGVITMMRWNLQNDEKRNQLWEQNLKACGQVGYYQDINGDCTLVQELR